MYKPSICEEVDGLVVREGINLEIWVGPLQSFILSTCHKLALALFCITKFIESRISPIIMGPS